MDNAKPITSSKTIWFNALTIAATVIAAVQHVLPPVAMPYALVASALINVGLRLVTSQPVTLSPQQ